MFEHAKGIHVINDAAVVKSRVLENLASFFCLKLLILELSFLWTFITFNQMTK